MTTPARSSPKMSTTHILILCIGLAVAGGVLIGCSRGVDDVPPVADSTMVDVLADLHLSEARNQRYGDLPPAIRDTVLVLYGLDSTRYAAAMRYYAEHPDAYVELYTAVMNKLNEADLIDQRRDLK